MIERVWTEDLPKCTQTSVANLGGEVAEDSLSFYCKINDNAYLYGVFEPHNGVEATRFILQCMAAEIILNPFTQASDEDICEMLRNAFISVEKAYVQNYDEMIAERTSLQYQLQTLTKSQISKNCDQILERLKEIDQQLSEGTTVVIALIYGNKLYIAHVGSCRALLCRTDTNSVLRVVQLSAQHALGNADEQLRLARLGLSPDKLRGAQGLGNQTSTRCLGNYIVKGLYQAFPDLRAASSEPVIPTAEIHGPITLDDSCRFLVLVSSVVYNRLQEIRGSSEQINKQIAQIIVENLRKQTQLKNVSQSVLEDIDELVKTHCSKNVLTSKYAPMTMLIRKFNYSMLNAEVESNSNTDLKGQNVRFNPIVQSKSHTILNTDNSNNKNTDTSVVSTNQTTSSDTTSDVYPSGRMPYDKDKKVKGYVDFTCFYENVERARQNGTLPDFFL